MALSKAEVRLSPDATNGDVRPGAGGSRVDMGRLFEAHRAAMFRTILAYAGGRGELEHYSERVWRPATDEGRGRMR